jgi:hypothetical protein
VRRSVPGWTAEPPRLYTLGHLGPIDLATGVFVVGALFALPDVTAERGQLK